MFVEVAINGFVVKFVDWRVVGVGGYCRRVDACGGGGVAGRAHGV